MLDLGATARLLAETLPPACFAECVCIMLSVHVGGKHQCWNVCIWCGAGYVALFSSTAKFELVTQALLVA